MVLIIILLISSNLYSASFNCKKAGTFIEHTICGDDELSQLDEDLSAAYKQARENGNKSQIKKEQIAWIKKERNKCQSIACLRDSYTSRIGELSPEEEIYFSPKADEYFEEAEESSFNEEFNFIKKFSMYGTKASVSYDYNIKIDDITMTINKKLIPDSYSYAKLEDEIYTLNVNNIMELSINTPVKANSTIDGTKYYTDIYSLTISTFLFKPKYIKLHRLYQSSHSNNIVNQNLEKQFIVLYNNDFATLNKIKNSLKARNPDIRINDYRDFIKRVNIKAGGLCFADGSAGNLEMDMPVGIQTQFNKGYCIKSNKTLIGYMAEKQYGKYSIKVKVNHDRIDKEFFWVPNSLIE